MIAPPIHLKEHAQGLGLPRSYKKPAFLVGLDTETLPGKPYTFQQATDLGHRELTYVDGCAPLIRQKFYELLDQVPNGQFALGAFYFFRFDVQTIFFDKPDYWKGSAALDAVDVDNNGVLWTGALTWPTVFLRLKRGSKKIFLIDLFRFWEGGLARCCEKLDLPVRKMEHPPCVVENREPTPDERAYFEEYALIDAEAALSLLGLLDSLWEMDDNPPSFSNAHESGRVFKKRYAPGGLDAPDILAMQAGEWAYHGGRNALRLPTVPCVIKNCSLADVSSQYPAVCYYDLPAFYGGKWIWRDNKPLEPNGIYEILTGNLAEGARVLPDFLMDHQGRYFRHADRPCNTKKKCKIHNHGPLVHSWFTGVELIAAIETGALDLRSWWGFSWEGPNDNRPLARYMLDHYREKSASRENEVLYQRNKYRLNTLTGKFIATIPRGKFLGDGSFERWRLPGSLYNPPVAALITAHGRTQIYREECRIPVFHTATDSIVIPAEYEPIERPRLVEGLGAWEKQVTGDFICGRNKLYAFISPEITEKGFTGRKKDGKKTLLFYKGQKVLKYARHGFQGDILDFLEAAISGAPALEYKYQHMGGIRESRKRKDVRALAMNWVDASITFGGKYFDKV